LRVSASWLILAKKGRLGIFLTGFHPALKTFKPIRAWHDTFLAMTIKEEAWHDTFLEMTIKGEAWYFFHWISSSVKNIQAHLGLAPYLLAMLKKGVNVIFFSLDFIQR